MLFSKLASTLIYSLPLLATASPVAKRQTEHNDFSCRSVNHPNPVVLLHGLGATYYEDINALESYLKLQGFCTFSLTYGDYENFPFVGGLKPIAESAVEIGNFIRQVKSQTGAAKIDLVGHSEGAFQSLYVPKFTGVSPSIDRIIAIAPPTHGTSFANLYQLASIGGNLTRDLVDTVLDTVGCAACADIVTEGKAVVALNQGPIVQPGNEVTVITSMSDELVTPTTTSFVREAGVRNLYIQDFCPFDPVGHIGEAYDLNVFAIVLNTLNGSTAGPTSCSVGFPARA